MLLIAGCSKGSSSDAGKGSSSDTGKNDAPDAIVLEYMETAQSGKLDEAYVKANCTEECAKMVLSHLAKLTDDMRKKQAEMAKDVKISVLDTKIDGDKAVVTVKSEYQGKAHKVDVKLKKVDGKWKIDMKEEDMK